MSRSLLHGFAVARSHRAVLHAFGAALALCLPTDANTLHAQAGAPRKFIDKGWVGVWRVGGNADDELFAFPRELLATKDGVYVLDIGTLEVIAFDQLGRKRWVAGSKGKGPGQFIRPVDLTLAPNGDIAVLDPGNARVTYFAPNGTFRRSLASPGAVQAASLCITSDARTHFWISRPATDVLTLEANGKLRAEYAFPWQLERGTPPFLRGAFFARGESGRDCAFATLFGFGVGRVSARGVTVSSAYIEPVVPPVIKQERIKGGGIRSTMTEGVNAALAAMRSGDTVLVHFAGSSPLAHRLVDLYLPTGYLETWTTPGCGRIAFHHPWLYCMTNMSEDARLVAFAAKSDTAAVLRLFPKAARNERAGAGKASSAARADTLRVQPAR